MNQDSWSTQDFHQAKRFWLDVLAKEDLKAIDNAFGDVAANPALHQDLYTEMAFFTALLLRKKAVYQYIKDQKPEFKITLMVFRQLMESPENEDYLFDLPELSRQEALHWAIRDSGPEPMSSFATYCMIKSSPGMVSSLNELVREKRVFLEEDHAKEIFSMLLLDYMSAVEKKQKDDFFAFADFYVEQQLLSHESQEEALKKMMDEFFLNLERHYRHKPDSYLSKEQEVEWVNWCFQRFAKNFTDQQVFNTPIERDNCKLTVLEFAASIKDPYLFSRISTHIVEQGLDYFKSNYKYKNKRCSNPLEMLCIVVSETANTKEREIWVEKASELTYLMLKKECFSLKNVEQDRFVLKHIFLPEIVKVQEQFEFSKKLKKDIRSVKNPEDLAPTPLPPTRF